MSSTPTELSLPSRSALPETRVPVADHYPPGSAYGWYVVVVMTLVQMCSVLNRSVVAVVIEPMKREFHLSDSQLGILTGLAFGGSYAIASFVLATISHRLNRKLFLAGLVAVWSVFTSMGGVATSYLMLLLSRIAVGLSEAGGMPTMMSMMADINPSYRRTLAMEIFFLSASGGIVITFIGGGLIVVEYGWRAGFFMAGIPGLLLAGLILFTVREPRRGAKDGHEAAPAQSGAGLIGALRHIAGHRATLLLLIAMSLTSAANSCFAVWITPQFVRVRGVDIATAGMLLAIAYGVFGGVGSVLGGWLADRLGRRHPQARLMVAAFALVATTLSSLACLGVANLKAAGLFLGGFGLFTMAAQGPMFAAWTTISPTRHRGAMLFVMSIGCDFVGYGLGPLLCGILSDIYGGPQSLSWAIATVITLNLPAAVLLLMVDRSASQRT